ncbi:MAG: mechanosensitive ion channel [Bacilli bacterium]|nr:mechanosensitive ion channel [Bacilli bacterium]MDY0063575.1 mechanosensitive ion channel [Bacilli bacterium]
MFLEDLKAFFEEHAHPISSTIGTILVIAIILIIVSLIVGAFVRQTVNKRAKPVAKIIRSLIFYIAIILGIIIIFGIWGYDVRAILIAFGIGFFIVGLASRELLSDMLRGLAIVFANQFEVDDVVEINGFKGKVIEIGLLSTKLLHQNGNMKIVNNSKINELINYSRHYSLAVIQVSIAYEENPDTVISMLQERLAMMREVYPEIVEGPNVVGISAMDGKQVEILIQAKTNCEQQYAVERGLRKKIKELFAEHHIALPKE